MTGVFPGRVRPGSQWAPKDVKVRGRDDEIFANEFGVAADGTDQTDNLERAVAAATAAGKTLVLPPGTYEVSALTIATSGARVRGFGDLSTLRRAGGGNAIALSITGSDCLVQDLAVDGNAAGGGSTGSGAVELTGSNVSVRNVTVYDALSMGIRGRNGGGLVDGCRVLNAAGVGINYTGLSGVVCDGWTVTNCYVDKTGTLGDGIGLALNQVDGRGVRGVNVTGNTVLLPVSPASSSICIEIFGTATNPVEEVVIGGNLLYYGTMGTSTHICKNVTITGNVVHEPDFIGIEIVGGCDRTACSGNTVVGVAADTSTAIIVNGTRDVTVSGNSVHDCATAGITVQGASAENVSITGNAVRNVNRGVRLLGAGGGCVVSANAIDTVTTGVVIDATAGVCVTGNYVRNATNGLTIGATTAVTFTGTITGNNLRDSVTNKIVTSLSGGATIGELHRWANAGVQPSRAAYASTDALLIAQGVIQA